MFEKLINKFKGKLTGETRQSEKHRELQKEKTFIGLSKTSAIQVSKQKYTFVSRFRDIESKDGHEKQKSITFWKRVAKRRHVSFNHT